MKDELYNLGLDYINWATELDFSQGVLSESRMEGQLFKNYQSKKEELIETCNGVDLTWVKEFLQFPQIRDVFITYLQYMISKKYLENDTKKSKFKEITLSDVDTYIVSIIKENFPKVCPEEILVVRKMIEIMARACSEIGTKEEDSALEKFGWSSLQFIQYTNHESKYHNRIAGKLERVLQQSFVPQNPSYDKIKKDYYRALKKFYEMQFVYMLGDCRFVEFYIPPVLTKPMKSQHLWSYYRALTSRQLQEKRYFEDWKNIFVNDDNIYIVGGPGFGKSLFLKYIINNSKELNLDHSEEYLIIYCDLKTFYTRNKTNKKSIIDFFQENMIAVTGMDEQKLSKEFIQYYLDLGRCVVLLDALDEVPKGKRTELHNKITAFFSTCNPNNKICITSRARGFLPKKEIQVYEIPPLTTKDIKAYLDKMIDIKKFRKGDKTHFLEQAEVLIKKGFLNNFLALSLLVSIYRSENKLPENKTNLYKKCFEYIAREREIEGKDETGFDWNNIVPLMTDSTFISLATLGVPNNNDIARQDVEKLLLAQYKLRFNDELKTERAIKEFLDFCSNRTELFVAADTDDRFKFFHRSFFEYFYSRYINQCSSVEDMYELMATFDVDSEVFELTVALVKEEHRIKYEQLVTYLFRKAEEEITVKKIIGMAFHILTLAMQVIDDAYFKQKYFDLIVENCETFETEDYEELNNNLIVNWIGNAIEEKEDNRNVFADTYEKKCISAILQTISNTSPEQWAKLLTEKEDSIVRISNRSMPYNIDFSVAYETYIRNGGIMGMKFYMDVYKKYFNLFERLEYYCNQSEDNISDLIKDVSRSQKTKVKKGIRNYTALDKDTRKKLCEFMQNS